MRLASLTASNTEIAVALGLASHLVAVDAYSDSPEVASVPRVGPDLGIDVAALAALRPDLVLSSLSVPGMERVVAEVEAAGLPQLVLDPTSFADVLRDIRTVGDALGLSDRAHGVVSALEGEVDALRLAAPRTTPARVVVEWWPRPVIVAARDSWITSMLSDLGAQNAFADAPARSVTVSHDDLRASRPDLIVVSWCGVRKLRPEIVEARGLGVPVACVPESALGRPGPRLIEGYRELARLLAALAPDRAAP